MITYSCDVFPMFEIFLFMSFRNIVLGALSAWIALACLFPPSASAQALAVPISTSARGCMASRLFKPFIGGSWTEQYVRAAVVHDFYIRRNTSNAAVVHRVFHDALLASGAAPDRAYLMYKAVNNFGPTGNPLTCLRTSSGARRTWKRSAVRTRCTSASTEPAWSSRSKRCKAPRRSRPGRPAHWMASTSSSWISLASPPRRSPSRALRY
jgi:Protein of unknown function (DUF1353)